MKVLVSGSEGFVAKNLINRLNEIDSVETIYAVNRKIGLSPGTVHTKEKTDKVHRVYTCLENEQFVRDLFKHVKPSLIFHLASSQGKDHDAYAENVGLTNNILKYCPEGCRVIFLSSSTVYGDLSSKLDGAAEYFGDSSLRKIRESGQTIPTNLYGSSKLSSESIINAITSAGKISSVILRPCSIIGSEATRGAVADIIKNTKSDSPELELFGDSPGSSKPFLNIFDMVEALIHFGFSDISGETYNISPADHLSIEEVANIIKGELGSAKPIKWLGKLCLPIGDNSLVCMDNTKALNVGWQMKFDTSEKAIKGVLNIVG